MNIDELLNSMSLQEKLGQLTQMPPNTYTDKGNVTGPNEGEFSEYKYIAGSTLGFKNIQDMVDVQKDYLENSRLKIPMFFANDAVHGYRTTFPIPLAQAASFNTSLVKKAASITASECYYAGVHLNYSPMCDLSRDSRWGRIMESYGEDVYLASQMTKAVVEGYQKDGISNKETVASCIKHFLGYATVQAGRDYNHTDMSRREMIEFHLPIYDEGIKSGAHFVMTAFNTFEGLPISASKYLLQDVLKSRCKFEGTVISDWGGVREMITNRCSKDGYDASVRCFNSGVDIEMCSTYYLENIKKALDKGEISLKTIDDSVRKVLNFKKELGLFEDPFRGVSESKCLEISKDEKVKELNLNLARESIVLLKNEKCVLPISKDVQRVAVIGPNANETRLNGYWTCVVENKNQKSMVDIIGEQYEIVKTTAYDLVSLSSCDLIIYCGGEKEYYTGESKSRANIDLDTSQQAELENLKKIDVDKVFINFSGRANILTKADEVCDSVVQAWFLGENTTQALFDILTGRFNPCGKLPISFTKSIGQMPYSYSEYDTGRYVKEDFQPYGSAYCDESKRALYPFGHGLSYGKVSIDNITILNNYDKNKEVDIVVNLSNNTQFNVNEVVQVYINDVISHFTRPRLELKAFEKINIESNSACVLNFTLGFDSFKTLNDELEFYVEDGEFEILIGFNSKELIKNTIKIGD